MTNKVKKIGSLHPPTAIIRATTQGNYVVSAINIRDRLIKNCISTGIETIFVLAPAEVKKPSYIEYANENSAPVNYCDEITTMAIPGQENNVYIEDGVLLHPTILTKFLTSTYRIMKNPTSGKIILSKDDFTTSAQTSYQDDEIFEYDPFLILDIQGDNLQIARTRLFKWLSKESDGFISKTLNRPISTIFSKFFAEYPLPPLYFSGATAFFALLMTYVLILGGATGILWGSILFHITSIVDGIDGEIARAKFQSSRKGTKIDTTIDMITNILFMGTMSYALWSTYGNEYLTLGIYIVSLVIIGVSLMTLLLYFGPGGGDFDVLADILKRRFKDKPWRLRIFNFCNYCLKRDTFAFIFAVYAILGLGRYIPEFLIFGLIVWNLAIILNAGSILKLKKSISGL